MSFRSCYARSDPSPHRSGVLSCHLLLAYRRFTLCRLTSQLFCSNFFSNPQRWPSDILRPDSILYFSAESNHRGRLSSMGETLLSIERSWICYAPFDASRLKLINRADG